MADLNKVFLIGRLTRDPELRYTPSGSAVTDLGLAVNRTWTGNDGERKEETLFIDVTVWARQAENCCHYLKKGRSIHVEGSLRMETWDDRTTGEKRSKVKVLADRVQFLDSRRDEVGVGGGESDSGYVAPPAREPASRRGPTVPEGRAPGDGAGRGYPPPTTGAAPRRPSAAAEPEEDEDIPF